MKQATIERMMSDRKTAVESAVEKMLKWYLVNNGGIGPDECVELKKGTHTALRWLEPPLPHLDNPMLVETYEGDHWVLKIEKLGKVS